MASCNRDTIAIVVIVLVLWLLIAFAVFYWLGTLCRETPTCRESAAVRAAKAFFWPITVPYYLASGPTARVGGGGSATDTPNDSNSPLPSASSAAAASASRIPLNGSEASAPGPDLFYN